MSYLILQIALFLGAAALLGVGFGWVMARRDVDAKVQEERDLRTAAIADWKSRHQEALDLSEAARNRISALETELDGLRRELLDRSDHTIRAGGSIGRDGAELERLREAAAVHNAEKENWKNELAAANELADQVRASLAEKDALIAKLERGLEEREEEVAEAQARTAERPAGLAVRRQEAPSPPSLFETPVKDDLKKISGVGPKLERLLNKMDIFNFRQIAGWSEDDIDRVQAKLHEFPGRIRRDDWVTGAKREHRKKYGEEI